MENKKEKEDQKERVIKYLKFGVSLEAVVMELARMTEDETFINECHKLIQVQQFLDKKKDLDLKFNVLTSKMDMLDEHSKQGLDERTTNELAANYWETIQRMQKAMNKL